MVKKLLISLLLFSKIAFAQVSDHFDDGDFSKNPLWYGDTNYFMVNAKGQLQSTGQRLASQILSLSMASKQGLNVKWEFLVQLNFNPTATNYTRIYLVADQENLKGPLNGYFIQIGETGSTDGYHLYRQRGTSTTRILTGAQKTRSIANTLIAKIKVTRDDFGKWELFTDITGGNRFTLEGSVTDNTFTTSAFMGIYCRYATASRYNQFIFDDFDVEELVLDVTPPSIKSVKAIDALHLDVAFSEDLDLISALNSANYELLNYGHPVSIETTSSSNVYRLTFSKEFVSGHHTLTVKHTKDKKGNVIAGGNRADFFYIRPYTVKYGDVVINEIFANPAGSTALPQQEFIELWNTTNEYILMQGWKYADQTSTFTFPVDTLKPNEHIILCAKADTSLFKSFGKSIGLSPWPSLGNSADVLTLSQTNGEVVDKVAYQDTWYRDNAKKKGGFTLELIDPKNICKGIQNWMGSQDISGGTPGKQNSVYREQISKDAPKLTIANIVDSVTVEVQFSKSVDSLTASIPENYSINNGMGKALSVVVKSPLFNSVELKFGFPLSLGVESTLSLEHITDCAGNLIAPEANTAKLFVAKKIGQQDILISEILFNPTSNGVDFVEIYNNSDHVLDLKGLQLANANAEGIAANIKGISSESILVAAESYWILSAGTAQVKAGYFSENPNHFVQLNSMPAYNNEKGTVILLHDNRVIDRFDYNDKMHIALLKDANGVSLERVSFTKEANEPGNFKSAAASVGFATPTYKNSQQPNGEESYVRLLSKTFSPDGDGFEDVLQLDYQLTENASLATINVFTDKGILIRKLMKNQTIGTKGNLTWDGLDDGGQISKIGIYIIVSDVFDLNGNTKRFKNTCVLAAKLN